MTRSRLLSAVAVAVFGVALVLGSLHQFWLAPAAERRARSTTNQALRGVGEAVVRWARENGERLPPARTMDEFWEQVSPFVRRDACALGTLRFDEEGHILDGWGRRLRLRVVAEPPVMFYYFVYSLGPNGRDDAGEGDDIRAWDPDRVQVLGERQ